MQLHVTAIVGVVLLLAHIAWAQVVTKPVDGFELGGWRTNDSSTVGGRVAVVDEDGNKALLIEPHFTGRFGGFSAEPGRAIVIPGRTQSIKLRYKLADKRFGLKVLFRDGWGRLDVGDKAFQWAVPVQQDGAWHTAEFKVPADWVQPISLAGISTDNWGAQAATLNLSIHVDDITVTTDLSDVDPATGRLKTWTREPNPAKPESALKECPAAPLRSVELILPAEGHVFAGVEPVAHLRVRNWLDNAADAKVNIELIDFVTQQSQQTQELSLRVEGLTDQHLPLKAERFGLYVLRARADFGDAQVTQQVQLAKLPRPRELSDEEKERSPYGLNYHSAARQIIRPFRDAGIVWFREYSFQYDWLKRVRGNGTFEGWPHYERILKTYEEHGAKVVAVLQKSIQPPTVKDGQVVGPLGPDDEWTRFIAEVLTKFPHIKNWEMSNEYDLNAQNARAERLVGWKNYQLYHGKLGELVDLLGNAKWRAVENGRAGIHPELARDCVLSGHFDKVHVINTHHYCGADSPEENVGNYNTTNDAWGGKPPTLLFDDLRNTTRYARADGKMRQHWHTEFGWDTAAGPIVSEYEQAVFLQREWMLLLAAGVEKGFWFYHFDNRTANNFFDGCGLMTWDVQPKLSLAALAGMTSVLPTPKYVGPVNVGPNTHGYVFEQDGKLVAALWAIRGKGPTIDLSAERVVDFLGNDIDGRSVELTMAPTFAVGIAKDSPLFRQTPYSIDSDNMLVASPGDPLKSTILIDNNRPQSIDAEISFIAPDGWVVSTPLRRTVPAGEQARLEFDVIVAMNEQAREQNVIIVVREGGQVIKQMPLRVMMQPRVALTVDPIVGEPGETTLSIKVGNRSRRVVDGEVTFTLPKSWSVGDATIKVAGLQPGEQRTVTTPLKWQADWSPDERAAATFSADATTVAKPIIPNRLALRRTAQDLKIDADLSDWSAQTQVPAWTLGSTHGDANAVVYLGWSPEGIAGAVQVRDSKVQVREPRNFWTCDVFELFIDTANSKQERKFAPGDHQFFLVPQPDQGRVFVGRWKVNNEIPATQYDIAAIRSAARRTEDGYVMEFLIPASELQNYQPGRPIGLNFNLTVVGRLDKREVFWSRPKSTGINVQPMNWSTAELID